MTVAQIKVRRDASVNWATANPILTAGEPGFDTTLKRLKIGDGVSSWSALGWATMATDEVAAVLAAAESIGSGITVTDGSMKAVLDDPESAFSTELNATIGAVVDEALGGFTPGVQVVKNFFGTNATKERIDAVLNIWIGDPDDRVEPVYRLDGDLVIYPTTGEVIPAWVLTDVPGLAGWFDAQSLSVADAANVTSWTNRVSGAGAATPLNSIPTMDIDGINGHPCVHFPNQGALITSGYSGYSGDHTIYIVGRGTDASTNDFFFDAADATPTSLKLAIYRTSTNFVMQRATALVGPTADTGVHILMAKFSGTTGTISVDGGTPVTGTIAAASTTTDYVIGARADNTNKLTGDIGEIIIVRGLVSSADHAQIIAMLEEKWGL